MRRLARLRRVPNWMMLGTRAERHARHATASSCWWLKGSDGILMPASVASPYGRELGVSTVVILGGRLSARHNGNPADQVNIG
jgi:hypothetical protein